MADTPSSPPAAQPFPQPVPPQPFLAPPPHLPFNYPPPPLQYPPFLGPPPSSSLQPQLPPQQQPPPHLPHGFFNPWEPPPPFVPPPSDSELQKRIDKLVEYAVKNGPEFEKMIKEKQKDNPAYAFLFGAEGHNYYRYRLWMSVNPYSSALPPINSALAALNPALNPAIPSLNPAFAVNNPALNPSFNSSLTPSLTSGALPSSGPFNPFYEQQQQQHHHHHLQQQQQQHLQPFFEQVQPEAYSEASPKRFKGLSGPLPTDVAAELLAVLEYLTGTKESIKGAKTWFMQRSPFAPALAESLRDRVLSLDDVDRQLHVIYLANDILFDSLQRRVNPKELDNEALAFQPVLGPMLAAIYRNPQNQEVNQSRLQKILEFWGAKEVYSPDIINALETEMAGGVPKARRLTPPPETSSAFQSTNSTGASVPPTSITETGQIAFQSPPRWQSEQPQNSQPSMEQSDQEQQSTFAASSTAPHFIGTSSQFTPPVSQSSIAKPVSAMYPSLNPPFLASLPTPIPPVAQPTLSQLPTIRAADHPPYPLFPPGLIPGMVRKMQIGSGVPYSPLSPLDIPTVIPPPTTSDSYMLERVAKFFRDIGEADPLEGQVKAADITSEDGREEDERSRLGGARIPPPANFQVDADTNTLPDGSIENKPGATSTGRLGLGAAADPNEVTQYDDVYSSYRKQQSSNYHTFMSARAAAR